MTYVRGAEGWIVDTETICARCHHYNIEESNIDYDDSCKNTPCWNDDCTCLCNDWQNRMRVC